MKKSTKYIVTPVIISAIAVSGYSSMKLKAVEKENVKLKNEIENKVDAPISYDINIEEIEEINKKNIELIVYESGFADYELNIKDDSMFGIDSRIKAEFRYIVTIDMSKAKISTTEDKILVHVDLDNIKLKEIIVNEPEITYDTNLLTQMRGKRIMKLEADMISKAYQGIEKAVENSCKMNKDNFKLNLIEKLNRLYDSDNVKVILE